MTGCARCAELAALAARPTNAVGVPCAHCGVPGWLANPTPGFPYAGCIGCYWGAVARAQLPRDGRDAGHRSASGQSFFDRIRAREPEG